MKSLTYLICLFSAMAITHSSVQAVEQEGIITYYGLVMGSEHGDYFNFVDLDGESRWRIVHSDDSPDLDWQVGDHIVIHIDPHSRYHSAQNLDKQNWTYLIQIRLWQWASFCLQSQ
jgi:hypothetical protein